ncbi:hypothetical protein NPIL_109851 [Nephila pilipes]|uniref:Uncharacterized protein n=1 Tax=Nephila pilipes TaxID=299642 RepID=A0A8X6T9B2_NEPPI|nr:hypothetical protein NPIL_109851 [Nephila pilipes]
MSSFFIVEDVSITVLNSSDREGNVRDETPVVRNLSTGIKGESYDCRISIDTDDPVQTERNGNAYNQNKANDFLRERANDLHELDQIHEAVSIEFEQYSQSYPNNRWVIGYPQMLV